MGSNPTLSVLFRFEKRRRVGGTMMDRWRGVRVAEGARLESVCRVTPTVGSNPTLSVAFTAGAVVHAVDARA